ncbi:MAG: nicotinamide mononucleotide transporter [Bacteroidales bacterium]|nr:MAG: nicotinamide mononucleotide transporter [Bacteroidales bacterium]
MSSISLQWFYENYNVLIEIFGAITGLLYLYFSIKQNIWLWPLGLITSALYVYVFFITRFYADMGLNVYYVVISIYGWYHWLYGGKSLGKNTLNVSAVSTGMAVILVSLTIGIYWLLVLALKKLPELLEIEVSELLYWDAFTTAASIIATWMLARKIIEHWLVWIVVDAVSLGLYFYKGMYPTVILFLVYTVMAIKGYIEWKKDLKTEKIRF